MEIEHVAIQEGEVSGHSQESDIHFASAIATRLNDLLNEGVVSAPPVIGILMFGSRMDPEMTPRKQSDIDTIFITDAPADNNKYVSKKKIWEIQDQIIKVEKKTLHEKVGAFLDIQEWGIYSYWHFLESIQDSEIEDEVPVWAWKPKAVF